MFPFKDNSVRYRIRVFDHGLHIKTAEIEDRGQPYITLTVKPKKLMFFGDEVKLAFQINPEIPPKIFGNLLEVDFDIRDSTQLGDLLDITPDLVFQVNEGYKKIYETKKLFAESKTDEEFLVNFSEPQATSPETPTTPPKKDEDDDEVPAKKIVLGIQDSIRVMQILKDLKNQDATQAEKKKKIEEALALCTKHPKLLYWLPKRLNIGQEIHAIVSQSRIERVGIKPSSYTAEVNSRHVEKTLARPKEGNEMWNTILIIAVMAIAVVGLVAVVYFLTHH
jgi:hypothetical protein